MKTVPVLFASLALVAGCSTGMSSFPPDAQARAAVDAPEQFARPGAAIAQTGVVTCWNPMSDPRDGAVLSLVRSVEGRGDYEVPAGRYGVNDGELLRLDCASGAAIGIVRR
jgi:hypothetical protein